VPCRAAFETAEGPKRAPTRKNYPDPVPNELPRKKRRRISKLSQSAENECGTPTIDQPFGNQTKDFTISSLGKIHLDEAIFASSF